MIYPIVIYGSDVLRKPCERITPDYPEAVSYTHLTLPTT